MMQLVGVATPAEAILARANVGEFIGRIFSMALHCVDVKYFLTWHSLGG